MPENPPSDAPKVHHLARTHPDPIVIQTITSLDGGVPKGDPDPEKEEDKLKLKKSEEEGEKLTSKRMVEEWNSHMHDNVVWYPSFAKRLCDVLKEFFKGCLEAFKRYCLTVASADFLTGKAKNSKFKAFLFWAIKPPVIQDILAGAYGVKNFFTIQTVEEKALKDEINQLDKEIKNVDYRIATHEKEIVEGQKKLVNELKQTLTPDELTELREQSDREAVEWYRANRPDMLNFDGSLAKILLEVRFDGSDPTCFLNRVLRDRLGLSDTIITPQELLEKKKSLLNEMGKKDKEFKQIANQKKGLKGLGLSLG
jgi:hypothetical protein